MSSDPTPTIPPPDLPVDSQTFFYAAPDAAGLRSAPIAETSALQALGPSPFPKSGFPLLGFLESAYEHLAAHAAKRLPKA
jgi:hypothetical protein